MKQHPNDPEEHGHLSKLEWHLKIAATPKIPTLWKEGILAEARKELALPTNEAPSQRENEPGTNLSHGLVHRMVNQLVSKITPTQMAMASVWISVFISGKVDQWLNASSQDITIPHSPFNLTQQFTQQIRNWELADLDFQLSIEGEEKATPIIQQPSKSTPGPRSSLKSGKAPHKVAMGRHCHMALAASIPSNQVTSETLSSSKRPSSQLPVGCGSGTIRSTFNSVV